MSATYLAFIQVAFAGPTRIYLLLFYCHCLQLDLDTTATRELENINRKIRFSIFSFSQLLTEMGFSNGTSDQSYGKQLKIYFVISGNNYDLFLGFRVWPAEKLCGMLWKSLCSQSSVSSIPQLSQRLSRSLLRTTRSYPCFVVSASKTIKSYDRHA